MELDRLDVVFDGDLRPIEEKMAQFEQRFEIMMNRVKGVSDRGTDVLGKNFNNPQLFGNFMKQLEKMNINVEQQLNRMQKTTNKQGEQIGQALSSGITKGTTKLMKDVQSAVDKVNLQMQQAKAAQERIANLQADKNGARLSGDTKSESRIGEQLSKAQIQMNKAQQAAQEIVRGLKSEYDAIPQSLSSISAKMEANERQIEAMRSKVKALNGELRTQQMETGNFSSGKWKSTGVKATPRSTKTEETIAKQSAKMEKLIADNNRLQRSYAQMEDRSSILKTVLSSLNTELGEQSVKAKMATNGLRNLSGATKKSEGIFSRFKNMMQQSIGRFGELFNRQSKQVTSGTSRMSQNMGGFGRSMRMLWSQLFLFTFLYQGIMTLVGGLFKALQTNEQFSASLNQIKVNLLTAFYPIFQAALPAINALMSALAKVTGYIASFISTLFGMNIGDAFNGAQGLMSNVKSLDATSSAIKDVDDGYDEMADSIRESNAELKKQYVASEKARKAAAKLKQMLMGFDEINTLEFNDGMDDYEPEEFTPQKIPKKPKNPKGSGGPLWADFGAATIPETPKWLTDFADKFKDIMTKLFDPIKKAWDIQGKKVMNAWKYALREVSGLIQAIGKSFMKVWTNGTGQKFVENSLVLFSDILNIIGDIANSYRVAWEDNGRGTAFIQSIFDLFNSILNLLHQIALSFRNAWNDGLGEKIAGHLLEIFTNMNNAIKNLADRLSIAWQTGNVGESIFKRILGIIEGLLDTINNITKATKEWANELDFSPLLQSIDRLLKSIQPLTKTIGDGLEWFYKNVLLPLAGYTIEQLIPAFLDSLKGAIDGLNGTINSCKPAFDFFWNSILKPIAEWSGGVIVDVLKGIGEALSTIGSWISEHSEGFSNFVLVFGTFAATLKAISFLSTLGTILSSVFSLLTSIGGLSGMLSAVSTGLGTLIGFLGGPLTLAIAAAIGAFVLAYKNCEPFRVFINNLLEDIKLFADKIYNEYLKPAFYEVVKVFRETMQHILDFWNKYGERFIQACKNVFGFLWSIIGPWLDSLWQQIKDTFKMITDTIGVAWDFIKTIFSGAFKAIEGYIKVFTGIFTGDFSLALEGLKDMFSGTWEMITGGFKAFVDGIAIIAKGIGNTLINPIEGAVNGVIGGVNWVLSAVGSDWEIPRWNAAHFYAEGTTYHPGGPAIVNDGKGSNWQEMYRLPNGKIGAFPRRKNLLVDLPRGSQVLPGDLSASFLPAYSKGIFSTFKEFFTKGFDRVKGITSDVWEVISNPSVLIDTAMEKFIDFTGMLEPVLSIADGFIQTAKDSMYQMVVKKINDFTGFAQGGLVDQFGFYQLAEGNTPEMVVPLSKPQLALQRIREALDFMGYEGIFDLSMPEVFRDSSDGYSGGSISKKGTATMSLYGNGLEELTTSLIATVGEKITNTVMMALSNMNAGGNNDPVEIILEVDSTRLGQVTIKEINKVTQKTGVFPLNL